ncbi:MAG: competence/damage-inducible protein A [Dehalococcoidia bacterium]|nr:competence/damage-inducible protein A [Dehalococcoidia bacterium]
MKAEIVATGTELLLGEIADINSAYIASQLSRLGVDLYWMSTVGDNIGRLVETLKRACQRSDLVITTGGLGPTQGDITRDAIAAMLDQKLEVDPDEERRLRQFFASRGIEMPASNIRQATRISCSQFLPNPSGTAPGWWVESSGRIIVTLPGPPEEMRTVWDNEVVPRLKPRLGEVIIFSRVLKTFGISEAKIGEILGKYVASSNPTLATYAKFDGIHLRITAKADSEESGKRMVGEVESKVREIVGNSIWGEDSDSLEASVARLLTERKLTVSVMESCTGGLLSAALTNVPGSSGYFRGGVVSYPNEVKVLSGVDAGFLVKHGAVSGEVATAMATAIRKRFGSDIGIAVTGVAGPSPMEGKSPGTVFVGIDDGGRPRVISRTLPGNRQRVRERATTSALFDLRSVLVSGK